MQQIFKCPITNYYIEYIVDDENKCALINSIVTDYQHLKPLCALLRLSIDVLKNKHISHIKQNVSKEEYENFLKNKTSWNVSKEYNDSLELECDVNDFLENYGVGIGLGQ